MGMQTHWSGIHRPTRHHHVGSKTPTVGDIWRFLLQPLIQFTWSYLAACSLHIKVSLGMEITHLLWILVSVLSHPQSEHILTSTYLEIPFAVICVYFLCFVVVVVHLREAFGCTHVVISPSVLNNFCLKSSKTCLFISSAVITKTICMYGVKCNIQLHLHYDHECTMAQMLQPMRLLWWYLFIQTRPGLKAHSL